VNKVGKRERVLGISTKTDMQMQEKTVDHCVILGY
jgi:cell division protein FtsL